MVTPFLRLYASSSTWNLQGPVKLPKLQLGKILRIQNARIEVQEDIPENESETARKFRLLREKREAVKRKQEQKNSKKQKLLDLIQIGETYGIDTKKQTLCSFYGLIDRKSKKVKYEQDYLALLQGCKDIKLEDWRE